MTILRNSVISVSMIAGLALPHFTTSANAEERPVYVDLDNLPIDQKQVIAHPAVRKLVETVSREYGPLQEVILEESAKGVDPTQDLSRADRGAYLHFIGNQVYDQVCLLKITVSNDLMRFYAYEANGYGAKRGAPRVVCED